MDLAFTRAGRGAPLLLVHGTGMRGGAWAPVAERLADRFDAVAVDLPGHGISPAMPGPHTPGAFAEAVAAFARERLGWATYGVAGLSIGGAIALELAAMGAARAACALSPVGFWTAREALFCRASIRIMLATAKLAPHEWMYRGRAALLAQAAHRPRRWPRDELLADLHAIALAPAVGATIREGLRGDYRAPAPAAPVTIAWAEHDRLVLTRQAARARRRLPGARHVLLRGCGHVPFHDDPGQVAQVIADAPGLLDPHAA